MDDTLTIDGKSLGEREKGGRGCAHDLAWRGHKTVELAGGEGKGRYLTKLIVAVASRWLRSCPIISRKNAHVVILRDDGAAHMGS